MIANKIKKGLAVACRKTGGAAQAAFLVRRSTVRDPIFGDKIEEEKIKLNNAIVQKIDLKMIDGDLIKSGDLMLVIDCDQVVNIGDHLIVNGAQYVTVNIEQIKPAGKLLAQKIQVRSCRG